MGGWRTNWGAVLALWVGLAGCGFGEPPADGGGAIATPPPLVSATLAGDTNAVEQLLQQGTDPNRVYNTNTALTYAARDGFTEIARLLINYGADVNWIDGEG